MNPVSEITAPIGLILGLLIIGFGGTYWYLKDKIIISSGPGALFDFVVWKCFGTLAVFGAIVGYIVGGLLGALIIWLLGYWYIIAFAASCIAYILTGKNMNKALVVGGVVAILGFGANSYLQSEVPSNIKSSTKYANTSVKNEPSRTKKSATADINNNSISNEYPVKDAVSTDKIVTSKSTTNKYLSEQKTDLSLGGVDIGDTLDHVRSVLGQERTFQTKGDSTFFKYNHIEVEIRNGMVYSVMSENNEAMTKKGIHEGSDFSDVLSAYGKDYTQFSYDDLLIYEYKYTFKKDISGILRFAVNKSDNKVNYIGVRLPD